jgi:hypothetical protein
LGYILQSGAGAVLCFPFDGLLVTARLSLASLDKLSGLLAIFKRSANQIKPLSHNKKLRKEAAKTLICNLATRYDHQGIIRKEVHCGCSQTPHPTVK